MSKKPTKDPHKRPSAGSGHIRCGFCATGYHHNCATAIRLNAKTGSVWRCDCTCKHAQETTKCVVCLRRGVEISGGWTCADKDDCLSYRNASRKRTIARLIGRESTDGLGDPLERTDVKDASKLEAKRVAECLCCGEPTKGGRFLPGHDSRFLSAKVKEFKETGDDAVLRQVATVSEAFLNKFRKRAGLDDLR